MPRPKKVKGDWYVVVNRSQTLRYFDAEGLHKLLNPPPREDGTKKEWTLLKEFPKPTAEGGCVFSSYKRDGSPVWPYEGLFILKNGSEVYAPDPVTTKVEVEVSHYQIDGYKEATKKVAAAKKAPAIKSGRGSRNRS